MQIKFHGRSCFSIKDSNFIIVTDPYDEHVKVPALEASVITVSRQKPESSAKVDLGEPKIFDWPGEYEVAGIHLEGIASFHNPKEANEQKENTIFKMELNGVHLCHLGWLGTRLSSEQLEKVGDVDILFIPIEGKETIDIKKAKEVIEQIEPRIIIPMGYCGEGDQCDLGALAPFLSEMGAQASEPLDEFILRKSELPEDASKVIVLRRQE